MKILHRIFFKSNFYLEVLGQKSVPTYDCELETEEDGCKERTIGEGLAAVSGNICICRDISQEAYC